MKIGIIGAGNVGGTLGAGWRRKGHEVMFGVRDTSDANLRQLLKQTGAKAGAVAEAAAFGEVVVLSVPWPATEKAILNAGNLSDKILLDCTNPVTNWPNVDAGMNMSGGETVAQWATGARVVKIFNTTGYGNMANPNYGSAALSMFYAGDDAAAKAVAAQLATDIGFEPVDAGQLANSRHLEMLASLWGTLSYSQKMGMNIGFRLLRR